MTKKKQGHNWARTPNGVRCARCHVPKQDGAPPCFPRREEHGHWCDPFCSCGRHYTYHKDSIFDSNGNPKPKVKP